MKIETMETRPMTTQMQTYQRTIHKTRAVSNHTLFRKRDTDKMMNTNVDILTTLMFTSENPRGERANTP